MKTDTRRYGFPLAVLFLLTLLPAAPSLAAADSLRMDKNELRQMLGSEALVIIDARAGRDWSSSEFKIKGAVREDADNIGQWADKYAKDHTIVIYCA